MTDRVTLICRAVAHEHKLPIEDLMESQAHTRHIARPRQIAMALARELTTRSLPDIGSRFKGGTEGAKKHHTTVLWGIKRCAALRASDSGFEALYQRCKMRAERYFQTGPEMPEVEPVKGKSSYAELRNEVAFLRKRVAELQFQAAVYAERERRAAALDSVFERARSDKACVSGRAAA
jgi:hypothetical protein